MKKKNYIKPTVKVINLRQRSMILCGSPYDDPQSEPEKTEDEAPKALLYDGIFG